MILPSKHLSQDRALLTIGAHILKNLTHPKTVSSAWEDFAHRGDRKRRLISRLTYDQFVLALDLLFLIGAVELEGGRLSRRTA